MNFELYKITLSSSEMVYRHDSNLSDYQYRIIPVGNLISVSVKVVQVLWF